MPMPLTALRNTTLLGAAILCSLLPPPSLTCAASSLPTLEASRHHRDDPAPGAWAQFPRVDPHVDCLADESAWPSRLVADGQGGVHETNQHNRVLGVVIDVQTPVNPVPRRAGMNLALPLGSIDDARLVVGLSAQQEVPEALQSLSVLLEEPGSFVYRVPPVDPAAVPRRDRNGAAMTFRFVSLRPLKRDERGNVLTAAIDRTWFQLYEPRGREARGAVLLMPGMVATPPGTLASTTQLLLDEGWAVLRMLSQPARFNQDASFTIDPAKDAHAQIGPMSDLANQRAAEVAYAAQAAWAHVEAARPALAAVPKAVVGFSAGAITIPTTIAREPQRYKAAVMVGGGAEFFLIVEHCEFKHVTGVEIDWLGGRPSRDVYERFSQAYLESTCLDPYHTAARMRHIPSFVLMGGADQAVPSPLGDLLWERLGKPRRVRLDEATHLGLFLALPAHYGEIAAFIAEAFDAP